VAEKQKYRMTFKCSDFDCGHQFVKITTNLNLQNPQCPECKKRQEHLRVHRIGDGAISATDLEKRVPRGIQNLYSCRVEKCHANFGLPADEGFVPSPFCPKCGNNETAFKGTNSPNPISNESKNKNKSVDSTADIIMNDYKMTDLRDDARMGESSAPKLPPAMQAQADNFFNPGKNKQIPFNARQLKSAALRGSYKNNAADVGAIHRNTPQPKIDIIHKS
jgi:hypothetical protein